MVTRTPYPTDDAPPIPRVDLRADVSRMLARIEVARQSGAPIQSAPISPVAVVERGALSFLGPAPDDTSRAPVALDVARRDVQQSVDDYLATASPLPFLLIPAPASFGKTYMMVRTAERLAAEGKRVLYLGPRHDFFRDLLAIAERPDDWLEWLPRQAADEFGKPETCQYADPIGRWLTRGHEAMDFCRQVCGWAYVSNDCPYHAQKKTARPIIFGMHQHFFMGHPLMDTFDVVIGDEFPVNTSTLLHAWQIPAEFIIPASIDRDHPLLPLTRALRALAASGASAQGRPLLDALGGPDVVLDACDAFPAIDAASLMAPPIYHASAVDDVEYAHLPALAVLLAQEATAALQTTADYLTRVLLQDGGLTLLLRRYPVERAPQHVIWLDATGSQTHLYETAFGRPARVVSVDVARQGRIFQVADRLNNKTALIERGDGTTPTAWTAQMQQQIRHIVPLQEIPITDARSGTTTVVEKKAYDRVGVITFKDIETRFDTYETGHFGAARGTNVFEGVDALFVAGTPQPSREAIVEIAKMLWPERMQPFQETWSQVLSRYPGQSYGYAKSGYHADPDLSAVLWQFREAEIIQTLYRARLISQPADVWLLTNLPIDEVEIDYLLTLADVFDVPTRAQVEDALGVRYARRFNPHKWGAFVATARRLAAQNGNVIRREVEEESGLAHTTAIQYWQVLRALWPVDESEMALRPPRPGPRPEMLRPP